MPFLVQNVSDTSVSTTEQAAMSLRLSLQRVVNVGGLPAHGSQSLNNVIEVHVICLFFKEIGH